MAAAAGVFKIRVLTATLSKDFALGGEQHDQVKLHLRLGEQSEELEGKGLEPSWKGTVLFKQTAEEKLVMRVYGSAEDPKVGYAEILLTPLIKIPDTRHEITVHSVYRLSNLSMEDKESAVIELEIIYTDKFRSWLDIRVIEADLKRNTEIFGKMDPYVRMQIGQGEEQLTTVKQNMGIHPRWDESFSFEINNPMEPLKLAVMDKDITKDDCVGEAVVFLRAMGYLQPDEKFTTREVPISFKKQDAGKLVIATRYSHELKK